MKIVTLTMNPALDKSIRIEQLQPYRKLRSEAPAYDAGGGGINVSRAIKILGGESLAIFAAGGPTGDKISELLTEEGVEHRMIRIEDTTRENLMVMEKSTEDQFRFGMEQEEIAREIIRESKAEILIVSLGPRGAMVATKKDIQYVIPPTVKKKSVVGAGDSILAGIILSQSRGEDLITSVKYGVAAGTAATMTPGTDLCRKEDVEKIYEWLKDK